MSTDITQDEENSMTTSDDILDIFGPDDDSLVWEFDERWVQPKNWWDTGVDPKVLFEIARDDGIPVVEVPPSEVLRDLVAAPDRNARMMVLLDRKQEIVDLCKKLIFEYDDPWADDARELTGKALAAYEDGHQEAAMALAVSVSEPLAIWASTPRFQAFDGQAASDKDQAYREKLKKPQLGSRHFSLPKSPLRSFRFQA